MATVPALVNVADGDSLSPAKWNTDVVSAVKFLVKPPAVKVRNTTDHVIGSGASYATGVGNHFILAWPSKMWDTEADYFGATAMWSSGDNTRIYIRTPGVYQVNAQIEVNFTGSATGYLAVWLRRNGTTWGTGTYLNANRATPDPDNSTTLTLTCQELMAAGDYIEVVFTNTNTSAVQLINLTYSNSLAARMVSAQ